MISASASPFARMADAWPSASAVRRCSRRRQGFDALPLDFGSLEDSCDQFLLTAIDFCFLDLDLAFFFDLLHADLFGDDLLLHDVA